MGEYFLSDMGLSVNNSGTSGFSNIDGANKAKKANADFLWDEYSRANDVVNERKGLFDTSKAKEIETLTPLQEKINSLNAKLSVKIQELGGAKLNYNDCVSRISLATQVVNNCAMKVLMHSAQEPKMPIQGEEESFEDFELRMNTYEEEYKTWLAEQNELQNSLDNATNELTRCQNEQAQADKDVKKLERLVSGFKDKINSVSSDYNKFENQFGKEQTKLSRDLFEATLNRDAVQAKYADAKRLEDEEEALLEAMKEADSLNKTSEVRELEKVETNGMDSTQVHINLKNILKISEQSSLTILDGAEPKYDPSTGAFIIQANQEDPMDSSITRTVTISFSGDGFKNIEIVEQDNWMAA